MIRELAVALGGRVSRGQTLFVLESKELESQTELVQLEVQRINIELAMIHSRGEQRALLPQKTEELAGATARLESTLSALESNRCAARMDGVVAEWDESLGNGTAIGERQILGKIIDPREPEVVCYIRDSLLPDVAVRDRIYFSSDARPGRIPGVVTFVNCVRATILERPGLSSLAGNDIAVAPDGYGRLEVLDSYYEVEVSLDNSGLPLRLGQTGTTWMRTAPRSRLADFGTYVYRVLLREGSL